MFKVKFKALFFASSLMVGLGAQADDLTIGALFPLSGSNSSYGDIFGSGVNLAVQHINDDELLDGKLSVKYEDTKALPQPAVVGMNKLVNVNKVPYVLSAFTGVSKAISVVGEKSKTVGINGGGVGPDLAELGDYFWNIIPLVTEEIKVMMPYTVKELDLKRYVTIYVDDPLGNSVKTELEELLPKLDAELAGSMSIPVSMQQFSGIAAKVRSLKPDAVYLASYGNQQSQLIKQLRNNGVKAQIISYSGLAIPEVQELSEAEGSLYTTQFFDDKSEDKTTKRFVDDYYEKHNKKPSAYTANYYNAVLLFAQLAHELQKEGKEVNGENLLEARRKIKSFDLAGGTVTFQDNGTAISPIQINQYKDKESTVVYKTENEG